MSLPEKLIKSAKAGNSRDVRKLIGRGVPITKDKFGNTALHEAAWNGHSDIVKLLLSNFCLVDGINNSGFTPLHLASQSGHGKAVKTLLKWRSNPSLLNQHGETAIHLAAKYNHPTVISVFVSFKINVDLRGKDGNTALHIAAKLGNVESVRVLLRGGANPHLTNTRGARPVEYAETGGFKHVIKLLNSKSKLRSRSMTMESKSSSRTPTPTGKNSQTPPPPSPPQTGLKPGASPQTTPKLSLSPRLHRANSASARFNYHGLQKRQISVPSALTSNAKTAQFMRDPSPSNSYEEIGSPTSSPKKISPKNPPPPTIDQLLTEIEQECHGSSYTYSPPAPPVGPSSGGKFKVFPYKFSLPEDCGSLSQEAWVFPYGPTSFNSNGSFSRPNSLQDYPYHQKSASLDGYEGCRGGGGGGEGRGESGLRVSFLPPHEMQAVQNEVDKTFQVCRSSHPSHSDDTYVFMAPCREVQSSSPQPSHSSQESCHGNGDTKAKIPKRAIICSSPVVPDQRHEPKNSLSPARGILSQPSSQQQTEMDRYLQQELETMRRAFQIRLAQLEKRYQRQLWMAQQRNSTTAVPSDVQLRPERTGTSLHRRSSWHSCVSDSDDYEEIASGNVHRCGSSQGFDSDINPASDDETFDQSVDTSWSHDNENVTPTTMTSSNAMPTTMTSSNGYQIKKSIQRSQSLAVTSTSIMPGVNGMKTGGRRLWSLEQGNGARAGPPPMEDSEGVEQEEEKKKGEEIDSGTLPPRAKALVNERVSEHRERILKYFQQVSEERIASIERQYESQMAAVENKYRSQATEKLSRLETRVKDLEKMLDVETIV